jgi:hypothetical protein
MLLLLFVLLKTWQLLSDFENLKKGENFSSFFWLLPILLLIKEKIMATFWTHAEIDLSVDEIYENLSDREVKKLIDSKIVLRSWRTK